MMLKAANMSGADSPQHNSYTHLTQGWVGWYKNKGSMPANTFQRQKNCMRIAHC